MALKYSFSNYEIGFEKSSHRRQGLIPREIGGQFSQVKENMPLRVKQRNRSQQKLYNPEFRIQSTPSNMECRPDFQAVAMKLMEIAEIDLQIQELKVSLVKHPDFDCYRYFRYLSNFTSHVTTHHLKSLVDNYQSHPLSSFESLMPPSDGVGIPPHRGSWSYSDFLKFLYPTSEHLSTLLLKTFKTKEQQRPQSARCNMKYDFVRFDEKVAAIIQREIEIHAVIKELQRVATGRQMREDEILREITQSRYILEHDIVKFIDRYQQSKNYIKVGMAAGLLKRMDVNLDGMVDHEDLQRFIFGRSSPHKLTESRSQENLSSLYGPQLSYRSTQLSSNCTVVPPQLLPSSSVPHLALFSNRSSCTSHLINSPNRASIHSGIVSSKSVNRLKCSPLRPQILTTQTSIVNSPSAPLNIILETGGSFKQRQKSLEKVGTAQNFNIREIQKRAKLRCFLNPPAVFQETCLPTIEEPSPSNNTQTFQEEVPPQHNPFLMTHRLSLLSQASKCFQNSDVSLHDTFLELIAEGTGSLNNSNMHLRLSNLSAAGSPDISSLRKQGSMMSTKEVAPFNMEGEDRIRRQVSEYIKRKSDGQREIDLLKQQLIQLSKLGQFNIQRVFSMLALGNATTNMSILQGTLLQTLYLSLSTREIKMIFKEEVITHREFEEFLSAEMQSPNVQITSNWKLLLKNVFQLSVKMEMDLEMLRFELYADLQRSYQAWVEHYPEMEYGMFLQEISPKSYEIK